MAKLDKGNLVSFRVDVGQQEIKRQIQVYATEYANAREHKDLAEMDRVYLKLLPLCNNMANPEADPRRLEIVIKKLKKCLDKYDPTIGPFEHYFNKSMLERKESDKAIRVAPCSMDIGNEDQDEADGWLGGDRLEETDDYHEAEAAREAGIVGLLRHLIQFQEGLGQGSVDERNTLFMRLFFSEMLTRVVKEHPNTASLRLLRRHERDQFIVAEPPFFKYFLDLDFSDVSRQTVNNLYETELLPQESPTGEKRYVNKIVKVAEKGYPPSNPWRLTGFTFMGYTKEWNTGRPDGGKASESERGVTSYRKRFEAKIEEYRKTMG